MDIEELADEASILSRDAFCQRYRHWFLIVSEPATEPAVGFETLVVQTDKRASPRVRRDFQALAIAKGRGNPYPERISVGRARNCDIVLRDASISKLHAHFRARQGGGYEVVDLKSQNGTSVNGSPLAPYKGAQLRIGDAIVFGSVPAKVVDAELLFSLLQ
jgi:hypothetical protein